MKFIKRLRCKHLNTEFLRNLHGDEIHLWNGKRSIWTCQDCGSLVAKHELMKKPTDPKKVLDGADMNQDIHQLIGYCVALGWNEKVFPSEHCAALAEEFLRKHRKVEPVEEAGNG